MIAPLLLSCCLLAAEADRPNLAGRVVTNSGGPVAGAHVLIDSASVRRGTSPTCPSCYPDCRKATSTDADGRFRLDALDPDLLFNVLVVADGYRPTFASKSDPTKGPVEVKLTPFDPTPIPPNRLLTGVVVDPDGKPLVGAKITPKMFTTEAYSGFSPDIFDPVAVTNLRGEFVLVSKSPIQDADLKVEGNGVAPRIIPGCRPERNPQRVALTRGAAITGRVVRDGQGVAGVAVGLVQASRGSQTFLGDATIGTDRDGRFTFPNVHPDEDYFVYGVMDSLKALGAVAAAPVRTGGDGTIAAAGDLPVVPGHRVRGRVILADGKAVPPRTRLMLSREDAWDWQRVELDADGGFAMSGLPTERYSLSVLLRGYKLSLRNHSIDPQTPSRFVGTIDADIDPLKILLEPAP